MIKSLYFHFFYYKKLLWNLQNLNILKRRNIEGHTKRSIRSYIKDIIYYNLIILLVNVRFLTL